MTNYNKLKSLTLIGAIAIISFFAPASNAQIPIFPNGYIGNDGVQIATNRPYTHNGRTYYYTQNRLVPNAAVTYERRNDNRFCPPGQRKKGHCNSWGYNHYRNDKYNSHKEWRNEEVRNWKDNHHRNNKDNDSGEWNGRRDY